MRAALITGPGDVSVVDRPEPEAGPGEALVAPAYVGLCGTDIELLDGSMPYFAQGRATLPLQPGHEVSGVVVESSDAAFPGGTPVIIDPVFGCGVCAQCADGRATHCVDRRELGIRMGMDGGAAELIAVPAANLHAVPDGVSLRAAVLTEPGVTAVHSLRRIGDLSGRALVIGGGTLGGIASQLLVARGLEVDVLEANERRGPLIEAWGARLRAIADESGYKVVIEAAGTADSARTALRAVAPGGSIAILGVQGDAVDRFDVNALVLKDVDVFGILNGPGLYEPMLDEIRVGNVRAEELVDREFALDEAQAAFAWLTNRERERPKVLLDVSAA